MGFGSYDESEQENQDVDVSEDDDESVDKGAEYEGEENFEFGESDTDDLIDQLHEMQDEDDE